MATETPPPQKSMRLEYGEQSQPLGEPSELDSPETMTEVACTQALEAFVQSGRTGRRNAMSDILNENASVSTSDLPFQLAKMSCSDPPEAEKANLACGDPYNKTPPIEDTKEEKKT